MSRKTKHDEPQLPFDKKTLQIYYPRCWGMLSGGKDSADTCEALDEAGLLEGVVALRTGIATPDWEEFVIKLCQDRGWPLEFYGTNEKYEDLVIKYGFPGPGKHNMFMNYLKGRGVAKFKKARPDAILASGVRAMESGRRKINTKPVGMWEGVPILAPIYHWTTDQAWQFFHDRGFERAPAYSTMQISGDCVCGAFAEKDEDAALDFHYPKLGEQMKAIGNHIKDKFPKRCKWGWGWEKPIGKKSLAEQFICVECPRRDLVTEMEESCPPKPRK